MGFIAKRRDLYRVGMKLAENKVDVEDVDRRTRALPRIIAVRVHEEEFAMVRRNDRVVANPASYTTIERVLGEGQTEDILTLPPVALRTKTRGNLVLTFRHPRSGRPVALKLRRA